MLCVTGDIVWQISECPKSSTRALYKRHPCIIHWQNYIQPQGDYEYFWYHVWALQNPHITYSWSFHNKCFKWNRSRAFDLAIHAFFFALCIARLNIRFRPCIRMFRTQLVTSVLIASPQEVTSGGRYILSFPVDGYSYPMFLQEVLPDLLLQHTPLVS